MKHTRFRRHAFFAFLGLAWAAGLVITWLWFRLGGSAERPDGRLAVPGLVDTVSVAIDTLGIPTVHAGTELDAWRALGWLHAEDRLWQLEFNRRIGSGRLAELFGQRAYPTDRFVRTLGLPRIARETAAGLSREERAALDAYAAGINARIARGGSLPPEFQILGIEPEPWTPEASLAVGAVMALDLSHWRRDLSRFAAAGVLPPEKLEALRPPYPQWGPRTLDGVLEPPIGTEGEAGPASDSASARTTTSGDAAWDPLDVLSAVSIRAASNAWVVGPSRTASGHPILANDMHLSLRAPSIWYLAALHAVADDVHLGGFTLPGVPGVVAGFNRDVAWGTTNAMVDDMDFVVETLERDGGRYLRDGEWAELEARPETIRVRNGPTRVDTVRATVRGPLISDALDHVDTPLSVMFVPDRVPLRLDALLAMNRSRSLEEFHAAAEEFTGPQLNFVLAQADGRIGYHLAGRIPQRGWDGAMPAAAAVVGDGWSGTWPPQRHPAATAPERDYIATANNLQIEGLDGAIGVDWPVPFRALRITRALAVRRDWTLASTARLQLDLRSLLADRVLPAAVAAARRIGRDAVADTLEAWDRMVDVDSRAAPLFYVWFYGLRGLVAGDEWAGISGPTLFPTISMLDVLETGDEHPWVDDVRTPDHRESLAELEERAMEAAIRKIEDRRWGDLHEERHVHPLGTDARLDRLFGFHVGPHPSPGGPNTVRPDAYQAWQSLDPAGPTPPWTSEYGPSQRLVVEMRPEGPRARALIPTGQSGNPFSPHYRDMNELWRAGELAPLGLETEGRPMAGRPAELLVLVPGRT